MRRLDDQPLAGDLSELPKDMRWIGDVVEAAECKGHIECLAFVVASRFVSINLLESYGLILAMISENASDHVGHVDSRLIEIKADYLPGTGASRQERERAVGTE
jgi:hypothetical protein